MTFDERLRAALVLGFAGDLEASERALQALVGEYPSNLGVRYELAMTQLMLGMFDAGCANIRQILSVNPNHEKALEHSRYC